MQGTDLRFFGASAAIYGSSTFIGYEEVIFASLDTYRQWWFYGRSEFMGLFRSSSGPPSCIWRIAIPGRIDRSIAKDWRRGIIIVDIRGACRLALIWCW